ncbi:MAG: hypothetical protein FJ255_01070 [Phycisphaerae bacterium]|nr:hypothetical protein [Phycisphaerae bacterium]
MTTTNSHPHDPRRERDSVHWAALVVAALLLVGCGGGGPKDRLDGYAAQSGEVLGTNPRPAGRHAMPWELGEPADASAPTQTPRDWAIALALFPQNESAQARQALARAQNDGLTGAYLLPRRSGWAVAYGRYDSPESPQAQRDLAMVKGRQVGDARPWAGAMLMPPEQQAAAGSLPDLDLRNARRLFGKAARYTLQINAYARADGGRPSESELGEFRRAAEQGAQELRRQGERAFYYHGPNMSLVTIGVFGDDDISGSDIDELGRSTPRPESMALQDARRKFPHMLLNGRGLKVRSPGAVEGTLTRSELVQIPEK